MISRSYDTRIEIWKSTAVADGFGGWVTSEALAYKQWANKATTRPIFDTTNGKQLNVGNLKFIIRNRIDCDIAINTHFVKYKGQKYVIDSIENKDLWDVDLVLNCQLYNG